MTRMLYCLVACLSALLFLGSSTWGQSVDETLRPGAFGWDVAEAVVKKIQRANIFSHDQNFLRRLGYVESRFGEDDKTYRPSYYGGIWQVDENIFNTTVNSTRPGLPDLYQGINSNFSINWSSVNWNDNLLMPLYSGLAARLYLATLGENIPGTIAEQANFWIRHYRPNGTASYFIDSVKQLESDTGVCEGLLDICMVLDGSGSIGEPGFVQAKSFIRQLVNSFSLETTRQAFVVYSDNAVTVFDFQHNLTSAELNRTIDQLPYPAQNTDTPAGLNRAVALYSTTSVRPGVPRIVATFTDGNHNRGNLPTAVRNVGEANLTSFAIGIGSQIDNSELIMIALMDPSKVFQVTNYAAFEEFVYQMTSYACEVPQEPEMGARQTGTLLKGERRYFKFDMPVSGVSLQISSSGEMSGWYSFTNPTPNSALNDGKLDCGGFYVNTSQSQTLYLGVKSESDSEVSYDFTPIGNSEGYDPSKCTQITTEESTTTTTEESTTTTEESTTTTEESTTTTEESTTTASCTCNTPFSFLLSLFFGFMTQKFA